MLLDLDYYCMNTKNLFMFTSNKYAG